MAAKLLHRERSPREPQGEPQSPFLDEELFAEIEGETAEAWASSMVGYQLDTPFQHAFEPEPESFLEPEVAELEERLYEKEAAEEYEFDDEWYDEELDELDDREFDEALKDEDLTGVFAGEEDQAEARGLGGPISGVLGEQRLLEHRGAAESEGFLFEELAKNQKTRRDCKHYPSTLRVTRWKRRTDSNSQRREAEFRRLQRSEKLKIAVLSRSRVRLPIGRVKWLIDLTGARAKDHWSKHLTDDLSVLVDEVNVTIELHRVLAPVNERDVRLLFENRTYRIHSTELRRCKFYMGWYGSTDKKEFLEGRFGIDLDRMFRRSQVPFPATRQSVTQYLLVAYASIPSWVEDRIRRELDSLNGTVHTIPDPPPELAVTRLGRARIELPVENVQWMLEESQRKRRTHWTRRLTVDLLQIMAAARKSRVTIDLLRVEGPVTAWQVLSEKLVAQFGPYAVRLHEPNADEWPFAIFQILSLDTRPGLERDLQVDLGGLLSLPSTRGIPTSELWLLVHVALPKLVKRLMVPRNEAHIAGFEFGKHRLTGKIRDDISLVGRHIADSWRGAPWYAFRPVRRIEIIGHTDSVGSEESNLRLGLARAREVEKWLKREIRRHWGASFEPTKRIQFVPLDSKGAAEPRKPDDPQKGNPANRRVEIRLDAPEPEKVLKNLLDRLRLLLDDPNSAASVGPQTTKKLKCMLRKLDRADVDDRYIHPHDVLNQKFSTDIFQSVRDFLMDLTYQKLRPEPQSDQDLLKALDDFTGRIYEVRTILQSNADAEGGTEFSRDTAKREWIFERIDPASDKGKKSIQSCFPPLDI